MRLGTRKNNQYEQNICLWQTSQKKKNVGMLARCIIVDFISIVLKIKNLTISKAVVDHCVDIFKTNLNLKSCF